MSYLLRKRGNNQKAHVWLGNDTACRMWSTGGLKRENFLICASPGAHEICHMCAHLLGRKAA